MGREESVFFVIVCAFCLGATVAMGASDGWSWPHTVLCVWGVIWLAVNVRGVVR